MCSPCASQMRTFTHAETAGISTPPGEVVRNQMCNNIIFELPGRQMRVSCPFLCMDPCIPSILGMCPTALVHACACEHGHPLPLRVLPRKMGTICPSDTYTVITRTAKSWAGRPLPWCTGAIVFTIGPGAVMPVTEDIGCNQVCVLQEAWTRSPRVAVTSFHCYMQAP